MYRLELLVSDAAKALYAPIATEDRSNDNAGVDLFVAVEPELLTGLLGVVLVKLGVKARMVRLSDGEEVHYWLAPRSSIFKNNLYIANSMGVIDRSYRGMLMAAVGIINTLEDTKLPVGTRIIQILAPDMGHIKEVRLVESLPETARGSGGFGSTGS
jgi:dUTP pyrophosphatase